MKLPKNKISKKFLEKKEKEIIDACERYNLEEKKLSQELRITETKI